MRVVAWKCVEIEVKTSRFFYLFHEFRIDFRDFLDFLMKLLAPILIYRSRRFNSRFVSFQQSPLSLDNSITDTSNNHL